MGSAVNYYYISAVHQKAEMRFLFCFAHTTKPPLNVVGYENTTM